MSPSETLTLPPLAAITGGRAGVATSGSSLKKVKFLPGHTVLTRPFCPQTAKVAWLSASSATETAMVAAGNEVEGVLPIKSDPAAAGALVPAGQAKLVAAMMFTPW